MLNKKQSGFSLVELLVGLATGLFLISGVLGLFGSTVQSQGSTLKTTRLNQELRTIMDLMVSDIRRAGYWGLAAEASRPSGSITPDGTSGTVTLTATDTPFAIFGNKIVGLSVEGAPGKVSITGYSDGNNVSGSVVNNFASTDAISSGDWLISNPFMATASDVAISNDSTCIHYSYDRDGDADLDTDAQNDINEKFGFRLNGSAIEMHAPAQSADTAIDCGTGAGTWQTLTSDTISVTELIFDDSDTTCINISDDDSNCDPASGAYAAPSTGDILLWRRFIDITITGTLVSDATVVRTLTDTAGIRNDRLVVY